MKTGLSITFILFYFFCSAQPYKKVVVRGTKQKDTALVYPKYYDWEHYQGFVKDSLPDGKWVAYFDDSTSIAFCGQYKYGKPNGLYHYYYRDGKIRHTTVYESGIENGPFTYWDENGTLSMIGQKINGQKEGTWYEWWSNGQLRKIISWKNDLCEGEEKYYYSDGSLNMEGHYSGDFKIGEWKFYHQNGQLSEQRFYADSLTSKERKIIDQYKNTFASVNFPRGIWKEYDKNGILRKETVFTAHYDISIQTQFYASGKKLSVTNFNGFHQGFCSMNPSYFIKNGLFQEWYENGNIKTSGTWTNHKMDGEWTSWNESGTIDKIVTYKDGQRIE